jgi:transcriptional regulator with XRE-family HTH domain
MTQEASLCQLLFLGIFMTSELKVLEVFPGQISESVLGEKIRIARVTSGMTQEEFAVKTGISRTYLGQLEKGSRTPSYGVLVRLEKEIPGISLASKIDPQAVAEGANKSVMIQDMVREHYDNETSKILAPFSKLEIIEKRSILKEINQLLQSTGRGVYENESPEEISRMYETFTPKEITFV